MLSKSHDIFKPENHARRATMTSKDRGECFAPWFFIFAFAQLRADDLKNDPQKCQKTPQMTQVVNTNHQMYKSL